jgi:hypothetical protein
MILCFITRFRVSLDAPHSTFQVGLAAQLRQSTTENVISQPMVEWSPTSTMMLTEVGILYEMRSISKKMTIELIL